MKYYLKAATGSTCYDASGLTYPFSDPVDFEALVREFGGYNLEWQSKYSNLPEVLVFEVDYPEFIEGLNTALWRYGLIAARHWERKRLRNEIKRYV